MENKNIEDYECIALLGVSLFGFDDMECVDEEVQQYKDCIWCLEDMKQYDGMLVSMSREGNVTIFNEADEADEEVAEGLISDLSADFMKKLINK